MWSGAHRFFRAGARDHSKERQDTQETQTVLREDLGAKHNFTTGPCVPECLSPEKKRKVEEKRE